MKLRVSLFLAAVIATGLASPAARADDLAGLEQEAKQLAGEKLQIVDQLQQSLTSKHANDQKLTEIETESSAIAMLSSQIEAQRPSVTAACVRTVPREQMAAAQAACAAVLVPFNRSVTTYNTRLTTNKEQLKRTTESEQNRAAEERRLRERKEALEKRLKQIEALKTRFACLQHCPAEGTEAAVDCYKRCWDGGAAGQPPVETTKPYQAQHGRRTFQQAIDDYKKSGGKPGPKSLKIKPVPPPPTK
jgi:hypothetical protein